MQAEIFKILVEKYLDETIQPDERQQLIVMLQGEEHEKLLDEAVYQELSGRTYELDPGEKTTNAIQQYLESRMTEGDAEPAHRVHFLRRWGWAAACLFLLLAAGAYFRLSGVGHRSAAPASANTATDVAAGKNGAILTLADGRQVVLDSSANGFIAMQNGARVLLKNGRLAYDPSGKGSGETTYNTITTPRGRQFHVQLPDGTDVWLNSASTVRYPTVFAGKERKVDITGEAYFEVARNTQQPFKLNVNNREEIEVMGTRFNVNAYENEKSLYTSLLQGAIRVSVCPGGAADKTAAPVVLQPGQQARLEEGLRVTDKVDMDKVMAWKNGLFDFDGMRLREVMRQLERWYDVEVVYEKEAPDIEFYGKLNRHISLSGVIKALEYSGVHFRIDGGRRLIVLR